MHCDSNGVSPSAYPLSVGPLVAAAEPAGYVYFYFFLHTLPSCCMGRSEGHVASPSPFLKDPPPPKKKEGGKASVWQDIFAQFNCSFYSLSF